MKVFKYIGAADMVVGAGLVIAAVLVSGDAKVPLFAVGGFLLPFGLIFFLVGRRVGSILPVIPRWSGSGTPAEATITGLGETGVTINDRPVVRFELEVRIRNEHPYPVTVQQPVPMGMLGSVTPGAVVAVLVNRSDRSQVAIDWSRLPGKAAAATPEAIVDSIPKERRKSAAHLLAIGRRGRGRITAMERMGELVDLGLAEPGDAAWEDDLFLISMDVKVPGFDEIPVKVAHRVPDRLVGKVGPGLDVEVAVSRDDPEHDIAIDWSALNLG